MDEQTVVGETTAELKTGKLVFPTARFGEVTVEAETLLHFPRGLVGLPRAQRFVFLHDESAMGPVFWMQSIEDPELAFLVCEPLPFFPDYEVEIAPAEQAMLGIRDEKEALVCVILVVPEDPKKITANLRGPVVIHTGNRTGVQLVLEGDRYSVRAPLLQSAPEKLKEGGDACSS